MHSVSGMLQLSDEKPRMMAIGPVVAEICASEDASFEVQISFCSKVRLHSSTDDGALETTRRPLAAETIGI